MAYKFMKGTFKTTAPLSGSSTLQIGGNAVLGGSSNSLSASTGTVATDSFLGLTSAGVIVKSGVTVSSLSGTIVTATSQLVSVGTLEITGASTLVAAVSGGAGASFVSGLTTIGNIASSGSITAGSSFIIGSADINETDLEKLDGITDGTAAANKAVVLDGSKNIATIGTVGCGAITSTGNSSFVQGTFSGRVISDDATEATSTTDGSLQTDGGLSVVKSAVIGDDLDLLSNGAILSIGSDEIWIATHANANDTLTVSADHRLAFGDAADYITGDGIDIFIVGSNEINLNATTIDLNGALDVEGATTLNGNVTLGDSGQNDTVTCTGGWVIQSGARWNVTASGGHMGLNQGALIVLCTGSSNQTVTLPDGSSNLPGTGSIMVIKSANSATRTITITGSAAGNAYDTYTIDGHDDLELDAPYAAVNLVWNGGSGVAGETGGGWYIF